MTMTSIFSNFFKTSPFKKTTELPKTAQDTIPFIEAYDNGLFLVEENKYTLIFAFDNIDYVLIRDSEQEDAYKKYMNLLNSLPSDIEYQEFLMNDEIDFEILKKAVIPKNTDGISSKEQYDDYCNVLMDYVDQTTEGSAKKIMLIAMSYSPKSRIENASTLVRYYHDLSSYFKKMKSDTHQLDTMQVFRVLFKFYHRFDKTEFLLPKNFLSRGHRIKDYIAPSMFKFTAKNIEIGDALTRIFYVKRYDRELDDTFIVDLLDNNEKITVSKHITHIMKSEANEMIRKKIFDLQGKIQSRKEKNYKSGTDFIPFNLQESLKELEDLQNQLSDTNCELFKVGVFVAVSAQNKEDLEMLSSYVKRRAEDHQVTLDLLMWQQDKGLTTILPFANNQFNSKNNAINSYLLSDAASVLLPFSTVNHFAQKGICYGISATASSSLIVLDRTAEMNSNGFVLATSGAGKSMFAKSEIFDVMYKYPNDEIIVIDPESEYKRVCEAFGGEILKIAPNSPTHFNLFDTDLSYSDEGMSAIAMKSQFIMTVVETAKGTSLSYGEKSIIDRCVRQLYQQFVAAGGNKDYLPTFTDFYNLLLVQPEQEAKDVAICLELYVKGSFNVFAHKTDVNINKNFLVIDIFDMGEQLRAVGLQVILEYLWQRVIENKKKGKRTWIWIDEFSYFFTDGEGKETTRSGDFFAKVYKRIRKHGGTVTGITQNITEVLESKQAQRMLGNAEFVVLLQQKKEDWTAINNIFNLSESQAKYLQTGEKGSGLIICGQKIIPFRKPIPKDSLMYKICETSSIVKEVKTDG